MHRGLRFAKGMRLCLVVFTLLLGLTTFGPPRPLAASSPLGLVMPREVDFGRLRVGQAATRQVPIRNDGTAPIWLNRVGLLDRTGNYGGGIVPLLGPWASQGCTNQWLQSGATCNVEVTVRGTRDGRHSAGIVAQYFAQPPQRAFSLHMKQMCRSAEAARLPKFGNRAAFVHGRWARGA